MKQFVLTKPCCYSTLGGSEVEVSACNAGDLGLIPGLGRSPGEGNGNPLQYSCLENPMDRGALWGTAHGVVKSRTQLSNFAFTFTLTYKLHLCTFRVHQHSFINTALRSCFSTEIEGISYQQKYICTIFHIYLGSYHHWRASWWKWKRRVKKLA